MRSSCSRSCFRQPVEVGNVLDQAALDELIDQRFAQAVDVHHVARGEMQNRPLQLCRAVRIDAAMVGLALACAPRCRRRPGNARACRTVSWPRGCSLSSTTFTTFGITSPPRSTSTQSPIFTPRSLDVSPCCAAWRARPSCRRSEPASAQRPASACRCGRPAPECLRSA